MLSRLRAFFLGLMALALAGAAWGQAFPTRPVRIIVPAGPGGPDVVGRIMAAKLTERMGQTFVVETTPARTVSSAPTWSRGPLRTATR